ncbi:MAG: DUF4031 domain-containing protein [Vulcanimicrobiota bacterium]
MKESTVIAVDRLFQARGSWWCHLLCDDFSPEGLQKLHEFAAQIGVPPRAFHDPPGHPRPHYDLPPEFREVAIRHGAVELANNRAVVDLLKRGRACLSNPDS